MTAGHPLSNGHYHVLVTPSGAGYSALGDILLTRWSADLTREAEGWFLYLRDLASGDLWSAGHQPMLRRSIRYQFRVAPGLVSIAQEDQAIEVRTAIAVDPDADVEWRRYTITNQSARPRRLEVTSCVEVVLNTALADSGHPAFSKLFVQTEYLPESGALLARRRPRSPEELTLFMGMALLDGAAGADGLEWETDRARFIGRGRTLGNPRAMAASGPLSGTLGNVLDPVLALRRIVELQPGASVRLEGVLTAGIDRGDVENALAAATVAGASERCFPDASTLGPATALIVPPPHRSCPAPGIEASASTREELRFFNGYGGFSTKGDEYVIRLDRSREGLRRPPLPWTNVIANSHTGFVASESGLGFTWSRNSRENRLTPWFNDPVCDPAGEALYIRDEAAGLFWSPTPSPVPGSGAYEARHGFGHTAWRHLSQDLEQDVLCFVPLHEPVKIIRLRIANRGTTPRRLSVYFYAEWVLGALRADAAGSVVTQSAEAGDVLFAENPASADFGRLVAFAASHGPGDEGRHFSADRTAFLGRYGSAEAPEGVTSQEMLDGRCGAGLDPCAAFQRTATLAPGATGEWIFLLGQSDSRDEALALTRSFAGDPAIRTAFEAVGAYWRDLLSAVQIETPSPALDVMVNGWLSYQNLSCRMWARSALYQSGGAFGFRDQLQDAAALLYHRPALTREQIVLHAGHQFVEGDVLHWWHPPTDRGIRTRFSDDLLWLPFVTEFYVAATGDSSVLEESAGFLTARLLEPDEDEVLLVPLDAGTSADVYEHCCRAIDRSLSPGIHGLPLIGSGDWNDGMNRVGRLGQGESVWLGFFLFTILDRFIPLCHGRGDTARVVEYGRHRAELRVALNLAGWDGEWYRRAYYDDGSPLGSKESDECRIDALAQAWAVLSGAAPVDRAGQALDAMDRYLVDESAGLIRLLTPPFDRTRHDPGYIKGYLPGVRENGGQYTHAALWAVRALAEAGRHHRAAHLLDLLNPVHHGDSSEGIEVYRAEPYVVAADVYGVAPHVGRGGWSWYTGSAGWMFRVALESILGLTLEGGHTLVLRPCIPVEWPGFSVRYRLPDGRTRYDISVRRSGGMTAVRAAGLEVGVANGAVRVELRSDAGAHMVEVELGNDAAPRYRPATGS
jgi:N,N'-diacetylchitobiose phosphorylase